MGLNETSRNRLTATERVPGRPAFRVGPISFVWRPRVLLVCLIAAALIVFLGAFSIGLGDFPISVSRVLEVVFRGEGNRVERLVVLDWRMPRVATAIAVGSALGLSGALTQTVTRNALASPDILGITTGASAMAVTVIVLGGGSGFLGWLSGIGIPLAALLGAIFSATAIWALAWRRQADSYRLVLFGIIITALLSSYINFLMIRSELRNATQAQFWLTGSLATAGWNTTIPMVILVIACCPLLAWIGYQALATSLGPDLARALGQRVNGAQVAMLALAVALAAVAVSAAGPIGFVAFVAPQVALRMCGVSTPPLAASALTSAVLLLGADIVTQAILPVELPVGIVTSALGGIFLIYLLVQRTRSTDA
ncbi:iron chelate uptake ABC transporter family permease subunit [Corynebacterium urealyticum]|uniref:FecCD family ABC transporter permease n=1 Tax=Corynebacterium urealyticum TaxID=43771 RepID=UPI0002B3F34F|nr:iron chelate uptake ABC transporter family permease subunit [Corynebacterium urealyticum]AGE35920.1 iron ABC transport system, permease [Corynebacterium urealyticum DSM 7111]QQB07624.1 iron chelate uptake ABC transporter family permease subunit [Corynebacterium urealyticum]QQE50811.1 iron chelate uptake ABC transporter family permease subunit [Corynebacterium urealyticum]